MGRVSKHKKIKSCDPFYKGPRVNPVRTGDLPPEDDEDQPPPKSFLRFLRYNKQFEDKMTLPASSKAAPAASKATPTASKRSKLKRKGADIPEKSADNPMSESHVSAAHSGRTVTQEGARGHDNMSSEHPGGNSKPLPEGRAAMFVRRPGESMRAYLERIDFESKNRIVDCFRKERKTSGRRKQYLQERKKKLKSRKKKKTEPDFAAFKDEVKFGEVVNAPPRLSAKPRGSEKKSMKTSKLELLKACRLLDPTPDADMNHLSTRGLKHQQDIEEEREKVISKYREVKKARMDARTAC